MSCLCVRFDQLEQIIKGGKRMQHLDFVTCHMNQVTTRATYVVAQCTWCEMRLQPNFSRWRLATQHLTLPSIFRGMVCNYLSINYIETQSCVKCCVSDNIECWVFSFLRTPLNEASKIHLRYKIHSVPKCVLHYIIQKYTLFPAHVAHWPSHPDSDKCVT